jgi:Cu+-exporting ATPase
MITGDHPLTANAVADDLGLPHEDENGEPRIATGADLDGADAATLGDRDARTNIFARTRPEQKHLLVEARRAQGQVVAMTGDGINDAPALAQAHVGIAMGTGTDVAMETAGITLVKGEMSGLVRARRLSRGTMRNIRQNLFWAFAYNVLGIPLAAGVLYPFTGTLLSPMIASAAMSFSSLTVIANALRLRRLPLDG